MGTHRLLSDDIKFHDLGLVIIDEEQRFGVKHKEKLKEAFIGVDMLTLSATPVSYTHLDVYKRQVLPHLPLMFRVTSFTSPGTRPMSWNSWVLV